MNENYFLGAAKTISSMCFAIYILVIFERILCAVYMLTFGEEISIWIVKFIISLGLCIVTLLLTGLRSFEYLCKGRLHVYRLNQLHVISDIIVITLGIITGLYRFWLFYAYMWLAAFIVSIDLIVNVVGIISRDLVLRMFRGIDPVLHTYTKRSATRYLDMYIAKINEIKKGKVEA